MFWFDKNNPEAIFGDIRRESGIIYDGRDGRRCLNVAPDSIMDFTGLPYLDGRFNLIVFDPPHLLSAGPKSWQAAKYGKLPSEWRPLLQKGFSECFRCLAQNGVLIFKWNEHAIPLREVLGLTSVKPLFGQTTTVSLKTHWIVFIKPEIAQTHETPNRS
jgi:hypothetical protein